MTSKNLTASKSIPQQSINVLKFMDLPLTSDLTVWCISLFLFDKKQKKTKKDSNLHAPVSAKASLQPLQPPVFKV